MATPPRARPALRPLPGGALRSPLPASLARRRPAPVSPAPQALSDAVASSPAHPSRCAATPEPSYALVPAVLDFEGPFDTALFHRLDALVARTAEHAEIAAPTLAIARGYPPATLFALAEVAHHYVLSGGTRIALVLFEGLHAIAPHEPYFALGLGYTLDRAGRTDEAVAAYRRAIALDPKDGRAELNLAELLLALGDQPGARHHLTRAARLSRARGEHTLADKAHAILDRVGAQEHR